MRRIYDGERATRGLQFSDDGSLRLSWFSTIGSEIATQSRTTTARKAPVKKAAARPRPRPRGRVAPPYRPNRWLVALGAAVLAGLALAFLVTIAVLWGIAGPLVTTLMVSSYAAVMYALWRVGVSRL